LVCSFGACQSALAQAGLRESLERLDRDGDGDIEPEEITPLARPYLERVAEARRMSLDRDNSIERWQEAARIYHAMQNGITDREVRPSRRDRRVLGFGPGPDEPMVPEFGLGEIKYPYTQEDVEDAQRMLYRADRNDDGFIDRYEARRTDWNKSDPFEMDFDKDDRLSRLELVQRYARRRMLENTSDELRQKAARVGNGIRDADRNDRYSEERSYWRRGGRRYYLTSSVLDRFDLDKNGRLDAKEAVVLGIPMGRIDVDRDGELSRSELYEYLGELQDEVGPAAELLPGWFYEMDVNRDDQVAMSEFASEWTDARLQEFQSLDINGDGLLIASEVLKSKSVVGGGYQSREAEMLPPGKTVISEIEITDDYPIGDLNVRLSITHTYTAHLDAYLTGPDDQRIELFTEVGGSDDHFENTVLDDQADYPINKARAPFKGSYQPEGLVKRQPGLAAFNGKSVKGVWQLVIRCSRSDRFGMLHSWNLIVTPKDEMMDSPVIDPPAESTTPLAAADSDATPASSQEAP
jgi:subtilisin-like proprotein convertase family protein/Ca2+-binding EF-hand superfamily protein